MDSENVHTFKEKDLERDLDRDTSSKNESDHLQNTISNTIPPIGSNLPISGTIAHSTTKSLGIRKAEVLTDQYKNPFLRIGLFISIFFVAYAYAVESTVKGRLEAYATSSFGHHSLLSTVGTVQAVIAAAAQPTFARLSDRFGRLELIIVSLVLYVVGTIVQSHSPNIDALSGGTVIYATGFQGIIVLLQIVLADFSTLNWRLAASFVPALPFIINTWVSGDIVNSLYPAHSWQYGYAIWAYVFPLSCIPLGLCFVHMWWLAKDTNEWKFLKEEENAVPIYWNGVTDNFILAKLKRLPKIVVDIFWEIDVIGIILIICVFGFILVPLTLAGGTQATTALLEASWRRAGIIAPLIIGFLFIPVLALWESKFAKFPLLPGKLMKDRGVWSALIIAVFINMLWTIPNEFMYTVLVVGMNQSIKAATRITSLYSFVSVIVGPLLGLVVTRVRRLKGFIIFGVLCWVGAFAILYVKRGAGDNNTNAQENVKGIIGGLCFMGFGAGFFTYSTQVSIATCTNHEYMAIVISIYLASYNIGSAIGSSISGAVWTNTLYSNMVKEFNKAGISDSYAALAYGDPFTYAINYTWGAPERIPVVAAYSKTQRILCLVALVLTFPLLFDTFFLRDHRLDTVQSLELDHSKDMGIKGEEGEVIVNDYDDDLVFKKLKALFKRNKN